MEEKTAKLFAERKNRVDTAIALGTPDRVPVAPFIASYMQRCSGSSYKDIFYNYEAAGDAAVKFYSEHPLCDLHTFSGFTSGKANELADSQMIDWPGKPGTSVSDYSSHQVIEREFMTQEEYPEMLGDFTGFMLRKYIPRAYPSLKGLAGIHFTPTVVLNTGFLSPPLQPGGGRSLPASGGNRGGGRQGRGRHRAVHAEADRHGVPGTSLWNVRGSLRYPWRLFPGNHGDF